MADEQTQEPDSAAADAVLNRAMDHAQSSLDEMQKAVVGAAAPATEADQGGGIELLCDVDLQVAIELGRTHMLVEDVLKLTQGSVVELDKLAGDPVDVFVNDRLIARGEVLVLNDNFCIRVSEIVADIEEQAEAAADETKAGADSV
jgi:flagellar motor switch protein FliN/FliY